MKRSETAQSTSATLMPELDVTNSERFTAGLSALRENLDHAVGEMRLMSDGHTHALVELSAKTESLAADGSALRVSLTEQLRDELATIRKDVERAAATAARVRSGLDALDSEIRATLRGAVARQVAYPVFIVAACGLEAALFCVYAYFTGALPFFAP